MPKYLGKSYKKIGTSGRDERLLHRIIAEKVLNHPLPEGVVVHHINGGKEGAIIICQDNGYHMLLHVRSRAYYATGDPHQRKCPFCFQWDYTQNMSIRKNHFSGFYYHSECDNAYRRNKRNEICEKVKRILVEEPPGDDAQK